MKKQAVYLVTWGVSMGGIEATLPHYINYLSEQFDFTIFSMRPKPKEHMLKDGDYKFIEGSHSTFKAYQMLYQFAKANKDGVFHLFNGGPINLSLLRRAGVKKIIYHIHGTRYWTPGDQKDKIKNTLLWRIALFGNLDQVHFIANSQYSRQRFHEQLHKEVPMDVVYNGFDPLAFNFEKQMPKSEFKIVVVGRLVDYKNPLRLIQESIPLFEAIPNCRIYFVGTGQFKTRMETEIKKLGLVDRFVFTGFMNSYEQIYRDASAVVSVSYNESFGNTLVEAILSDTPVFASDIPAHKEILAELPESILHLEDNLAEQLIERIKNIDFFKAKVNQLRPSFTKKFSVENHISRFAKFYQSSHRLKYEEV